MLNFVSGLLKLVAVSLITGAVLSALNLPAAAILSQIGLTPERIELVQNGVSWAVPNIILGSMVILPLWLVLFLLTPPKS